MSTAFEVSMLVVGVAACSALYRIANAILVHAQINEDIHNREVRARRAVREEGEQRPRQGKVETNAG